jgi:hypothetical protein
MHFVYGECSGNANAAVRRYEERFPQRRVPDSKTILSVPVAVVRDSRADVELATSLEDRRSQQYTWRDIVECVLVFIFLFITAVFW